MLYVADHQHALTDKRMKRIRDHLIERQTPGIMNCP
jgi:hypothetical protein